MKKENKYNLIEQYLAGNLSEQERSDFEKEIRKSDDLRAEIQLHREIAEVTAGEKFNELRDVLKNTDANWKTDSSIRPGGKIVTFKMIIRAIAATAVLLLGTMFWYVSSVSSISSDRLFSSNFEPYEMVLTQRSGGANSETENKWDYAISKYAAGDFEEAKNQFALLGKQEQEKHLPLLKLYEGVSALAVGESDPAINAFQPLLSEPLLKEQARWYLGLTYLQKGDTENAKINFQEIQKGAYKFKESQKIISRLD